MIKGQKEKAIKFANIAVDIDSAKVGDKIKNDPIFIPIMAKISIPFNKEEIENKDKNMKEKEIKAKEHLEDMFEVTRNLSYSDIKMLKNDTSTRHKKSKNKNRNEIQREID